MDKVIIIDAYSRGLLSRDECAQLLGIDPMILMDAEPQRNPLQKTEKRF